jgi:hypothetical protein
LPSKPAGAAGNGAPTGDDPRTNEWTAARQVISDLDGQLGTLRQYGFTFLAGLLSAQALISFPPTGSSSSSSSSSVVPPSVRLAIVLASLALIGAIYVSDIHLRSIQRDVALRAQEIERGLGMELTEGVSSRVTRFSENSIVVIYILLAGVAGILGAAVVSPGAVDWGSWLFRIDLIATAVVVALIFSVNYERVRDRLVAWSLDRYRCVQGDTIAVTLTNEGQRELERPEKLPENIPKCLWYFVADSPHSHSASGSPSTPADGPDTTDPLKGPQVPPDFTLKAGDIRTWWWDTTDVEPGSYTLHHVQLVASSWRSRRKEIPDEPVASWWRRQPKEIPDQRHRSIWVARKPKIPPPNHSTQTTLLPRFE